MSSFDDKDRCVDALVGNPQRVTVEMTVGELFAASFFMDAEKGVTFAVAAGVSAKDPDTGVAAQMDYAAAMAKLNDALAKAGGPDFAASRMTFAAALSTIEQKRAELREEAA